jgi:hypothetical protein
MSDALGLISRIRHTPLRDLLRARITGRAHWMSRANAPDLPAPAARLIVRVVKQTRLWSLERVAVADELVAHFRDALGSGASIDDAIDRFGNERQAARLICRAKVRNRPIVWHALRVAVRAVAVLCVIYVALTVRYWVGRPSPSVDYLAVIDNPSLASDPATRAWPRYREALAMIFPNGKPDVEQAAIYLDAEIKTPEWSDALNWIRTHRSATDVIHQAARKPILGYVFRPPQPDEHLRPLHSSGQAWPHGDTPLASLELPDNDIHLIGDLLLLDGCDRIEHRDASAIMNVESLLRLAEQIKSLPFAPFDRLGHPLRTHALHLVELGLTQDPALWSNEQLIALAHQLSIPRVKADLISPDHGRLLAYDTIQRAYTDDGHGDGRLTPAARYAFNHINLDTFWTGPDRDEERWLGSLEFLLASRADMVSLYETMREKVQADLRKPYRETLGQDSSWGFGRRYFSSWITRVRYEVLWGLPGLRRETGEYYLAKRDGVVVGIALELYRRDHDQRYPQTLNDLVPKYLPEVPADRITGGPLHYLLKAGQPLVYSAGGDGDDDGGRTPPPRGGVSGNSWAASWKSIRDPSQAVDGDWILYPEPDPRYNIRHGSYQ